MWECPNLVKINDEKYAFIFSPQGLESMEFKYQNIFQSGYIIGSLDLKELKLQNHNEFKELDMGFDFYAPQVFTHDNQNLMFGWVGLPDKDSEYPTSDQGWMYSLTMPRVLEYKNDVLYQKPFDKIENLRHSQILNINDLSCNDYKLNLESRCNEIILNLGITETNIIEVKFKFKDEYILLTYDKKSQICIIDRSNLCLGGKGIRKFKLEAEKELKLHMFIDNSIMEIYYQDGLEVTTLMYFLDDDKLEIEIKSDDKTQINELFAWKLRSVKYE